MFVAFANSKGGTIYISINDDRKIKRLKNVSKDMKH